MQFVVEDGLKYYFISFYRNNSSISIYRDNDIASLLYMTLHEYRCFAIENGALDEGNEVFFPDAETAQQFVDYLNDTYIVAMRLSESI